VTSDKAVREFIGHAGPVDALLVDAERDRLYSAGADMTVREWDLKTGGEVRRFERHQKDVTLLALSPDGQFIASGGQDDFICVWRLAGGE